MMINEVFFSDWGKIKLGVPQRVNSTTRIIHHVHKWHSAKHIYLNRTSSVI